MSSLIFQPLYEHGRVTLAFIRDSGPHQGEIVAKDSVSIDEWESFLRAELESVSKEKRRLRDTQEERKLLKKQSRHTQPALNSLPKTTSNG